MVGTGAACADAAAKAAEGYDLRDTKAEPDGELQWLLRLKRDHPAISCLSVARVAWDYRHLSPADVPLLQQMLAVFGEAFDEHDTYQAAVPGDDYLKRLLGKPHFIAIAALDGDRVVGGLAGYELEKFERARSEIYIYDLAVATAHRRQGIATALIEELKTIAATRGAYVIFVQADCGDAPAVALYSKLGTRAEVLHFDIKIGE